jgi:hypothetical protein
MVLIMNFKEYLDSKWSMHLISDVDISEDLRYHIENKINLCDTVFRIYSESYFRLIEEVRILYQSDKIALDDADAELVETDLGQTAEYHGRIVHLDAPVRVLDRLSEAEYHGKNVKLGKPVRTPGERKKFAVYVKTPSGGVKRVRFGDPSLKVKNNNPARAKSFRARHKCSEKKDKTTPGYWACHVGNYAKSLGLSSSRSW